MQTNLIRHVISNIAGCDTATVAKVLHAARFVVSRASHTKTLDLSLEGLCSALPPTKEEEDSAYEHHSNIERSLAKDLGGQQAAKEFLLALRNTDSYLYKADDAEVIELRKGGRVRTRKR